MLDEDISREMSPKKSRLKPVLIISRNELDRLALNRLFNQHHIESDLVYDG